MRILLGRFSEIGTNGSCLPANGRRHAVRAALGYNRLKVRMRAASAKSRWERGALLREWRETLSAISSVYGQLVWIASLRNVNTGIYERPGLSDALGEEKSHRTILASHEEAFSTWLSFSLEQQKADLDIYLSELGSDRQASIETWLKLAPYRNLIPLSARGSERELFEADFEALLALLCNEYRVLHPSQEYR